MVLDKPPHNCFACDGFSLDLDDRTSFCDADGSRSLLREVDNASAATANRHDFTQNRGRSINRRPAIGRANRGRRHSGE